jgi:hypothetical protein
VTFVLNGPYSRVAYLSLLEVARVSQSWVVVWLLGGRDPATDPHRDPGVGTNIVNALMDFLLMRSGDRLRIGEGRAHGGSIIAGWWLFRLISRVRGICDPEGRHTARKQITNGRSDVGIDGKGRWRHVRCVFLAGGVTQLKTKITVNFPGASSELIAAHLLRK